MVLTYILELRDSSGDLVEMLQNAYNISYTQIVNSPSALSFTLPADDAKAADILLSNEIWLRDYESGTIIKKFKLSQKRDVRRLSQILVEVEALDLMEQLGHELVIEYEADGATVSVIVAALIALQELTPAITVGTIAAAYTALTRSIKVDGDTILRALFRLRDTVGGYLYVDSDRQLQWPASLGEDTGQQIRYRKNLTGIERTIDYSTLVNRLYCYGAGEDTARIKLSDASGHAVDYVEDGTSQGAPPGGWGGIYIGVMVDKSITDPDTLLAWAKLKLAEVKDPPITYRVDTVDLSASSEFDFSFDVLQLGSTVTVIDEDLGIDVSVVVVRIDHSDLLHPERMTLELSTRTKDIADTLVGVYDVQQFNQHVATTIGAGQVIVKGAFTVQDWATGGETTIDGSNIETGTITATKIDVANLAAIEADLGTITAGDIRLGSGTIGSDFTGIRVYKDGTTYRVAGFDNDVLQAYIDSDGALKAGAGAVVVDASGIAITGQTTILTFLNNTPALVGGFGLFDASTIGIESEAGDDIKLSSGQHITLDGDDITLDAIHDIYLDPDNDDDVLPGTSATDDLGNNATYWDTIECVNLDDAHSPVRQSGQPLAALRSMRTYRRHLTLEVIDQEKLGKRMRREVAKAGGQLEVDWKDDESFPEEILVRPDEYDEWDCDRHFAFLQKRYERRVHAGKDPGPIPERPEPHTRVDVFAQIWHIIRAVQELAGVVDDVKARLDKLEDV